MSKESDSKPDLDNVKELLKSDIKVKLSGCDLDGIARGKYMAKSKLLKSVDDGFGFCNVVFGWDMLDKVYDKSIFEAITKDHGYSDIQARIDKSTYRRIPWENNQPFYLVDFYNPVTNEPYELCPRSLLKRIVKECEDRGYKALCGMEFEWYNFQETPTTLAQKKGVGLNPLTPGMFGYSLVRPTLNQSFFDDIFDQCAKFGVPLEALHTETGPGVIEAAIEYTDALRLADRAHLFKTSVKQLALNRGIMASFMAKPWPDLPGCSGHIHVSLADIKTGDNAFVDQAVRDSFIAGVLEGLPSIMVFLAPTVNSYKRLVENYWAPITISYGFENRTTSIRIIGPPTSPPTSTRLEIRVPGADVNPYLALASLLACGIHGVKNKWTPKVPPSDGDVTGSGGERLPRTLKEATEKMLEKGSLARKVLGDALVEHYGATRLHEWKQWETRLDRMIEIAWGHDLGLLNLDCDYIKKTLEDGPYAGIAKFDEEHFPVYFQQLQQREEEAKWGEEAGSLEY
ncbi:hypothetical protein HK104_006252 [Borealophlyctis nickersoniae]|nr:hypothetical protein HK104_006252 [Borealophlyctis nickersoniae]